MRALLLTPDYPPAPGGIQLVMRRLVEHLDGVEFRVVTLAEGDWREFDRSGNVPVRRIAPKGAVNNRLAVARLNAAGVVQGLRDAYDIVISGHVVTAPAAALIAAARPRSRYLQYLHADELRQRPGLVRIAIRRADAVIAVSRYTRQAAHERGCDPARLHLVNPGVDAVGAAPAMTERENRPTVLTIARMAQPYKGHDVMLDALALVRERLPDVSWVVIGDGPLRPTIEARVRELGLETNVRLLGAVENAERDAWLARAHVFAMPSRLPEEGTGGEGFGIVYLEAAAHGLPVVAGAVGGALDAVADGETGLLVDPTDPGKVADALARLLEDRELAADLGAAGVRRAAEFSWEAHAAGVREVIDSLDPRS